MVHLLVNIFHKNPKYIFFFLYFIEIYTLYFTFAIISVASVMSNSPWSRFVIYMVN